MVGMRADELLGGGDHGGEAAFHVGGAAPVQHAIADDRREGVAAPFLEGAGGHHIGVAGEAEQGTGIAAARPEVGDAAELQGLGAEADGRQAARHQGLTAMVLGCHRGARDEVAGQVQGLRHGGFISANPPSRKGFPRVADELLQPS